MQVHERIAGHVILLETPPADNPTLVPGTVIRGLLTTRRAGLVEHTAAPPRRARPPGHPAWDFAWLLFNQVSRVQYLFKLILEFYS
jgi:hypothetical protein